MAAKQRDWKKQKPSFPSVLTDYIAMSAFLSRVSASSPCSGTGRPPPRAPADVKKPGGAGLSMQQRRGASYMMWVPIHQAIAAMKAEAGIVKIQAQTMLPATPQRTADIFCEAPTPTIAPVMVWVVETGMPK